MAMKIRFLLNKIITGTLAFFMMAAAHAQSPVWSIIPLTQTTISVPSNGTATIQYQVTNLSILPPHTHTLFLQPFPFAGVTQDTSPGNCPNPFVLNPGQSCTLTLNVQGSLLPGNVAGGPVVCQLGTAQCYKTENIFNINVTPATTAFTVGGTITGLMDTLTLLNNGTDEFITNTDGSYAFPTSLPNGSTYDVTVGTQPTGQVCTVNMPTGTIQGANITNVNVDCNTPFTLGGTVSGLAAGDILILNDNDGGEITITAPGPFTFPMPIAAGSPYNVEVAVHPLGKICSVANGKGIMPKMNVTNVVVTCAINDFTVGGTISGLGSGDTVTLALNGLEQVFSVNGPYEFAAVVANESPYNVTLVTNTLGKLCTVVNGSGTIVGANVTNVNVTCMPSPTTTISVSPTATIPATLAGTAYNTLTVTNSGPNPALNVQVLLPPGWTAVTQDASACTSIPAGGSCNIIFSSTLPYVAQNKIIVTGSNILTPPTIAIAFTVQGFLVWQVTETAGAIVSQVVDTADLPTTVQWGNNVITGATDMFNGAMNTTTINSTAGIGDSAAVHCFNNTSGGATPGTWYLPAVCQMGGARQNAGCPGLANINSNLIQNKGFGGFAFLPSVYWSSTEISQTQAWFESFTFSGTSPQLMANKNIPALVRCARSLPLM